MSGPVSAALESLLVKHHIDMSGDELLGVLDSAFATIPGTGAAPLSAAEVDFLRDHTEAGVAAASGDEQRRARSRTAAAELAQAISGSVSIKEAATILGVDRSRVSRRMSAGTLWAFDLRGHRRIPRWEFLGADLLPGLDIVVPAIPPGATPAALDAFMHIAQPDFGDRTPIEYLAAGGDPALVAGFVADFARW